MTVGGPVRIRVDGARAKEGKDASLDFAVTLNRAASHEASVDYETADETATAKADYTAVSGTLVFTAGEKATHSTNVLIQSHILAGVKGSDCFRYLIDGTRIGAGDLRMPLSRVTVPSGRPDLNGRR